MHTQPPHHHHGWPVVFELDVGQARAVALTGPAGEVRATVRLIRVEHTWQPDYWVSNNPERQVLDEARVVVEVDGQRHELKLRPYQLPTQIGPLRLYVETTRLWASRCDYAALEDVQGDVRLAVRPAGESWGPADMLFPIRGFRWRSSTYNNTWTSLVPYNHLYYHRGEDYGAIPDRLEVQAPLPGRVVASPLPDGDGQSNGLTIRSDGEFTVRLAHMNIETIDPAMTVGSAVRVGQYVGRTGCTWSGRRSQTHDPHLHVGFEVGGMRVSPYPYLVEAYLRDMPDAVLAVAGGYRFALADEPVVLDATRSLARAGRSIASWTWHLHDGRTVDTPLATVSFDRPGLYAEELVVRTDDGQEDRDYLQVRVYDPARGQRIARGWLYHSPVRGLQPGQDVLIWNRLVELAGPATIDFGDGTPPEPLATQIAHAYSQAGLYTVTATARGPDGEPVTAKMKIVVEDRPSKAK